MFNEINFHIGHTYIQLVDGVTEHFSEIVYCKNNNVDNDKFRTS